MDPKVSHNIYFYHILEPIFIIKPTLYKLGTYLFLSFIRFLLIIDYWSVVMESNTNSPTYKNIQKALNREK